MCTFQISPYNQALCNSCVRYTVILLLVLPFNASSTDCMIFHRSLELSPHTMLSMCRHSGYFCFVSHCVYFSLPPGDVRTKTHRTFALDLRLLKSKNAKRFEDTGLPLTADESALTGLRGTFWWCGLSVGLCWPGIRWHYCRGDLGVCQSQQVTSALW